MKDVRSDASSLAVILFTYIIVSNWSERFKKGQTHWRESGGEELIQ